MDELPLDRLIRLVSTRAPNQVGAFDQQPLEPLLALAARHDPRVLRLLEALVRRGTSFQALGIVLYPQEMQRGKNGERWNEGDAIVGADELCIARNAGGDVYVWNGPDGSVRLLLHDEAYRVRARFASVDAFLARELTSELQNLADADDPEDLRRHGHALADAAHLIGATLRDDDDVVAMLATVGVNVGGAA